jgi:hypothetical protein
MHLLLVVDPESRLRGSPGSVPNLRILQTWAQVLQINDNTCTK